MFQTGDWVVKANTGLCRIENIAPLDETSNTLYYTLIPMDEKSRLLIPVDRAGSSIRRVLTAPEAWELIRSIPEIPQTAVENEKQREQCYRTALKSNDPKKLIAVIKALYLRGEERNARGKYRNVMDDSYFRMAEDCLYSELAYAIGCDKGNIPELIAQELRKAEQS